MVVFSGVFMQFFNFSKFLCRFLPVAFLTALPAAGQPLNGGAGLPHSRPAWVLEQGFLTTQMHARFWGTAAQQNYAPYGSAGERNIWDLQSAMALNYGLGAHLEAQITPVIYQSDQSSSGQLGQDISIGLALGSLHWPAKPWILGAEVTGLLPVSASHNLLFEEYSAGAHALTLTGLVSYATDPDFPVEAASVHLNLGYTLYDDVGEQLSDRLLDPGSHVIRRSQNLAYSAGLLLPGELFDFGLEGYGLSWMQKPPAAAEGRENFIYGSLSARYKPLNWLNIYLAADRRLSADTDETVPSMEARGLAALANYPAWRLHLGLHLKLLPLQLLKSSSREIFIRKADERKPVFEKIIDDGSRTPGSKDDLDRMRAERERAEKELERLKRIIENRQEADKEPEPDQNL
jgi:hypothetical protein